MTTRDPIDMLLSGRMDRRIFHKTLASLGLGLAVTSMAPRRALATGEEAHFYTWSGYENPEFHQAYIDKHGSSPKVSLLSGTTEAMHKIRAGYNVDIAHPCSGEVTAWHAAGITVPFDTTRLKHWNDYFEPLRNLESTQTAAGESLALHRMH